MGGLGSGRHYRWEKKTTVEDSLKFSLNKAGIAGGLNRMGPSGSASGSVTWTRTFDGKEISSIAYTLKRDGDTAILTLKYIKNPATDAEKVAYNVRLVSTTPHYGGLRWWFLCPNQHCQRRVGMLYKPPGGKYFLCRHCYDLTYTSCQESHKFDRLYGVVGNNLGVPPSVVKKIMEHRF